MENSLKIAENSLTYAVLLYQQKYCYPFIKNFILKKMVNKMLLNSDIQKNICSNDFTLSKRNKCNYVHY
jgi:hypothetical protein